MRWSRLGVPAGRSTVSVMTPVLPLGGHALRYVDGRPPCRIRQQRRYSATSAEPRRRQQPRSPWARFVRLGAQRARSRTGRAHPHRARPCCQRGTGGTLAAGPPPTSFTHVRGRRHAPVRTRRPRRLAPPRRALVVRPRRRHLDPQAVKLGAPRRTMLRRAGSRRVRDRAARRAALEAVAVRRTPAHGGGDRTQSAGADRVHDGRSRVGDAQARQRSTTAPARSARLQPGDAGRRRAPLPAHRPVDITVRNGLRVTSPPRTCSTVPTCSASRRRHRTGVADRLGPGTFETHVDCWVRLGRRRRPGTRTMAAVLRSRPAWQRALQSDLEVRVLAEIARQELPVPVAQWSMRLSDGRNIVVDFAWPSLRTHRARSRSPVLACDEQHVAYATGRAIACSSPWAGRCPASRISTSPPGWPLPSPRWRPSCGDAAAV